MLAGEHAVLHGEAALCAAIQQRLQVTLRPRSDRKLFIDSALGQFEGSLDDLKIESPFTFILGALQQQQPGKGMSLQVESEFSSNIGFGSSAAVLLATLAVLAAAEGQPLEPKQLFADAFEVLQRVQGRGSGTDLAAACFGGVVHYRMHPREIESFPLELPLSAHYAGYKTPTAEVLRIMAAREQEDPEPYAQLYRQLGEEVEAARMALRKQSLPELASAFRRHQQLQVALGVSDPTLDQMIRSLEAQPEVLAAKISGSGLGDCVIALGPASTSIPGYEAYPLHIDPQGVRLES